MNSSFMQYLQRSIALLDLLILNTIFFTAAYLFQNTITIEPAQYNILCMYMNAAWLVAVFISNMYHKRDILLFESSIRQSMKGYAHFVFLTLCLLFFQHYLISRSFLLVVLLSFPLSLFTNRILYLAIYQYYKRKDYLLDKVVIVGYNDLSKKLIENLEENALNKEIIGICDEWENINELTNYPVLSDISGIFEICKQYSVNEFFSCIAL